MVEWFTPPISPVKRMWKLQENKKHLEGLGILQILDSFATKLSGGEGILPRSLLTTTTSVMLSSLKVYGYDFV